MKVTELKAQYSYVKSHYGKAQVLIKNGIYQLQSYNTIVAEYNKDTEQLLVHGEHSQTTMRHLKDFINQYTRYYVNNNDDIRELMTKEGI